MSIVLYGMYLIDTLKGKLTPHPFSWIVWVSISTILFFAQLSDGAGPGAWMNGVVSVICFFIILASLKNGFKNIKTIDKFVFVLSMVAIPLWVFTESAFYSVILLTTAHALAFIPTFRKSWDRPYEEPVYLYGINFFRHGLSIVALANYSVITALAPAALVLNNGLLAVFLLLRRQSLRNIDQKSDLE